MDENIKNICLYGTYYNPAEKHYDKECDVICDKCLRHNLDISIGWQTYDLCLKCAQSVNRYLNKPDIDNTENTENIVCTKMVQGIFMSKVTDTSIKNNGTVKRMLQRQFIKKAAVAKK